MSLNYTYIKTHRENNILFIDQFIKKDELVIAKHTSDKQIIFGGFIDEARNHIQAPENLVNCYFQFLGTNNRIIIDKKANLKNVHIECRGNNNVVHIAENVRITGHWRLGYDCSLSIGKNTSSTNPVYMTCAERSKIEIGEDCMFATNNQIRTDDAHPIYDVKTGKRINFPKDIIFGSHVWVGYSAMLLGGTHLGNGSIVGAHSLVKNSFPNNCIVAGIPAKKIKNDIFWERENLMNIDKDEGYSTLALIAKKHVSLTEA